MSTCDNAGVRVFPLCVCSDVSSHTSRLFPRQKGEMNVSLMDLDLCSDWAGVRPEVFVTALRMVPSY